MAQRLGPWVIPFVSQSQFRNVMLFIWIENRVQRFNWKYDFVASNINQMLAKYTAYWGQLHNQRTSICAVQQPCWHIGNTLA